MRETLAKTSPPMPPLTSKPSEPGDAGTKVWQPAILVVDDEWLVRTVLDMGLRSHGFRVWLAAGGKEAIEVYRLWGHDIALILMDVFMPDLNGPQTLALLRQINPGLACCFMSGKLASSTGAGLERLGGQPLLLKPFRLPEVVEVVWQMVVGSGRWQS
jgi:two-component system cell cycle sensor histidine kinase/response regulator CckA